MNYSGFLVKKKVKEREFIVKFMISNHKGYGLIAKKFSEVVFLTFDVGQLPPLIGFHKIGEVNFTLIFLTFVAPKIGKHYLIFSSNQIWSF